jgi:hypothetical protein
MKTFCEYLDETTLNKTEKSLLDRAKAHPHGHVSATMELGVTGKGGYQKGGREHDAIHSLIKKGHLVHDPNGSSSDRERTRDKRRREKSFHTISGFLAQK